MQLVLHQKKFFCYCGAVGRPPIVELAFQIRIPAVLMLKCPCERLQCGCQCSSRSFDFKGTMKVLESTMDS